MDKELLRNGSGYVDFTTYLAMTNYQKEKETMDLYKGDIFKGKQNNGTEKYFVILSVHDRYSTVLMLNDNEYLPYSIKCEGIKYTDPGQLQYSYNDNFTDFVRAMTNPEFNELMNAVMDSLGYETTVIEKEVEVIKEVPVEAVVPLEHTDLSVELSMDLAAAKKEAEVYKDLYESLLAKVMG